MFQQQNMRFEREQGFAKKHAPSDEMHPTRMRRMRGIIRDSKVPLIQTAMPRPDEFGLTICDTITGGDDDVFGNLAYVPQPPVPAWQPRAANNQFAACADNNDILEGSVEIHGPNDGARPAATVPEPLRRVRGGSRPVGRFFRFRRMHACMLKTPP